MRCVHALSDDDVVGGLSTASRVCEKALNKLGARGSRCTSIILTPAIMEQGPIEMKVSTEDERQGEHEHSGV